MLLLLIPVLSTLILRLPPCKNYSNLACENDLMVGPEGCVAKLIDQIITDSVQIS